MKIWIAILVAATLASCSSDSGSPSPAPTPPLPSGTLDPAFGTGGKVFLTGGASAIVVDATGAAYVATPTIVKLDPGGQPVASYAAGSPVVASALAFDAAGNLYAASASSITKLDPNGNRVVAFGNVGSVAIAPFPIAISDLIVAPDGGIWAVGTLPTPTTDAPSLAITISRLDSSGLPIPTFGSGGRVALALPGITSADAEAAALDRQGNLLIVGRDQLTRRLFVTKVTAAGAPVAGFGTQGVVTLACGDLVGGVVADIGVDAADNIYVASGCFTGDRFVASAFKLDPSGAPVTSFGNAGRLDDPFRVGPADSSAITSLLVDASNGLYLGGARAAAGAGLMCGDFALAHIDMNGAPVSSFGQGGVALIDMGGGDLLFDLARQGGRLYAAGTSLLSLPCPPPVGPFSVRAAIARVSE
jgi:hypothetical protein